MGGSTKGPDGFLSKRKKIQTPWAIENPWIFRFHRRNFGKHFGNVGRSQLKIQPFFRSCWEIPVWCKRIMEDLRLCLLSFTAFLLVQVAGLWYVSPMFRSLDPLLIFNVSSVLLDTSLPKKSTKKVAEKPSVAKFVAESLSGGRMGFRKGQSRAVQTFEFVGWFPPAQQTLPCN